MGKEDFKFDYTNWLKGFKLLRNEDETRYKLKVYIDCFEMIKKFYVFYNREVIYKDHFDEQINNFIKMFKDLLERKSE